MDSIANSNYDKCPMSQLCEARYTCKNLANSLPFLDFPSWILSYSFQLDFKSPLRCILNISRVFLINQRLFQSSIYMFKVNGRNAGTVCETYSKLTIKSPQRRHSFFGILKVAKVFIGRRYSK